MFKAYRQALLEWMFFLDYATISFLFLPFSMKVDENLYSYYYFLIGIHSMRS